MTHLEHAETSARGAFDISKSESFGAFIRNLFSADFMPHGHCYWWRPEIVWLHVISDLLIGLAYFSIPMMVIFFVRKKKDLPFDWMFYMFAAFILWCGTTHFLNIVTLWIPIYRADGVVKAITALISVTTAVFLFPLIPKALSLRSARELEIVIGQLAVENEKRTAAEEALKVANRELERRVEEGTTALYQKVEKLAEHKNNFER